MKYWTHHFVRYFFSCDWFILFLVRTLIWNLTCAGIQASCALGLHESKSGLNLKDFSSFIFYSHTKIHLKHSALSLLFTLVKKSVILLYCSRVLKNKFHELIDCLYLGMNNVIFEDLSAGKIAQIVNFRIAQK